MLQTIQIIALVQGVFLLTILFLKRRDYKKLNFWLLFFTIISLLFHIVGDDDYNLLFSDVNWYIFHSPLVITLLFLLIKYHNSNYSKFQKLDLLYFSPYGAFILLQSVEDEFEGSFSFMLFEGGILLIMTSYLVYAIYDIIKHKKEHWMLYFIVPYAVIYVLDSAPYYLTGKHDVVPYIESYGVLGLSALLLYIILFKLVISPKSVLPKSDTKSYKTSSLRASNVEIHKEAFLKLMDDEKLFKDKNLTVNSVAKTLGIPRQHLSEILNVHMKTGFQDYVNKRRAQEFVECLKSNLYSNYTIMGIATEVGFKSKSTFNTTFKKIYGVTPSKFKKSLATT